MTENTLNIQALYVAYFNRPADPRGLEYWEGVVAAQGGSTAAVSAEFAKSAEYKDTYANMDNFSIVAKVYDNLFGRAGDLPGVNYWTKLLDSGAVTIDNVVAAISAGAQTSDKETVENRAAGAAKFTESLDTVDEIRAYATAAGGQVGRSFLSTITTDQSLTDNTSAAALTAVTNQLLNSLPATTTNLTAGIDNLPGTTGNDVFNAYASSVLADGGDATTLGSNDVIDGGAGNDTLNIESIAGKNNVQTGTIRNIETINIINNVDKGGLFGGFAAPAADGSRGTIDASKFVGATAVWQQNDAVNVTGLGTTTTAGFRNVTTGDVALSVAATGAIAAVALDAVAGDEDNLVTLNVSGSKLATVAVSGAVVKADADGDAAQFALNVTTGVSAVTVNTGLATTLTVAKEGTGAVTTVNAAGSTGAVTFVGAGAQSSITGGSAADVLTLATAFSTSVKAATVNGGAGNDTITVSATNAADATGVTATANGGEGNDTIWLAVTNGAENAVGATIDGGAGDDIVHIVSALASGDDPAVYRALSDNDTVTGGEGTDTIVVGSDEAVLDSGDYVRLQDLSGFEIVRFGNAVGTADDAVLAGELSKFTALEFMDTSIVTGVAATQKLVAYGDLTATTTGYATSGDKNNGAAAADVTVKGDSAVTVNAKSVALTVDTTEAEANVAATLAGDLDSVTAVLKSTADGDDADYIASLEVAGATFTTLTVTGTGSVSVDNSAAGAKLATIDTSALTGTYAAGENAGDAFEGLTFVGNAALKETITLGAGVDNLTINSTAGGTSLNLVDTITGFNIDVDTLVVEGGSGFKEFTFDKAPASLGAALNTASAAADDALVFTFGGNTYVFVETAGATANGNFEAGDIVVRLTGTYDLGDLAAHLNGPA